MRERNKFAEHFEVIGAGELKISGELEVSGPSRCGGARGVHIGVSWGRHEYAGGVMDKKEMRRLVECLQKYLEKDGEK